MTTEQRQFLDGLVERMRLKGDATSMSASLEARSQFLAGLMARLDRNLKIQEHLDERAQGEHGLAESEPFRQFIMAPWESLVWRVAGALTRRFARLKPEALEMLRVLEDSTSLLGPVELARDEVTHSRLLGWALRLEDATGQALRRAWVQRLNVADIPLSGWIVRNESVIGPKCRVDLEIEIPGRWTCLVEVKVDAEEREAQVSDYGVLLEQLSKARGGDATLVFLTLDGRTAQTQVPHISLSFKDLLTTWLPAATAQRATARYLASWLVTIARDVFDIAGEGPFASWSFAHQLNTLRLIERRELP